MANEALTPYLEADGLAIYQGDALSVLRGFPDETFDMAVTSPPFFALRDYGTGRWEGGGEGCDHARPTTTMNHSFDERWGQGGGQKKQEKKSAGQYAGECPKCGAVRIDAQIGLEATPEEFVAKLVEVFREVRRVLKPWGCLLLEVGDSYAAGTRGAYTGDGDRPQTKDTKISKRTQVRQTKGGTPSSYPVRPVVDGIKGKDLYGMPWMVAFALRADGWWLRGDYIWERPNPMPASVEDRCTIAHSYVFHLSKSDRYFWDPVAIAEPASSDARDGARAQSHRGGDSRKNRGGDENGRPLPGDWMGGDPTRNARSVWTIATEPSGIGLCLVCKAYWPRNAPLKHCGQEVAQHYAAFPVALAEKAIRAATSEAGVCPDCGRPWERIVRKGEPELAANTWSPNGAADQDVLAPPSSTLKHVRSSRTLGWQPTCECHGRIEKHELPGDPDAGVPPRTVRVYVPEGPQPAPVPARILDPFGGSGTSLVAARKLGRAASMVELSETYCDMAARRLALPEAIERAAVTSTEPTQLALG